MALKGFAMAKKNINLVRDFRREFSEKFTREFKLLEKNEGLIEAKYYLGRKDTKKSSILKPVIEDMNPPKIFLVSLDSASSGINTGIMAASTENVPENMVILSNETAKAPHLL